MFGNIDALLKIKKLWSEFAAAHPKFAAFLQTAGARKMDEGTVIDISITYPDGTALSTNMKVTQKDLELLETVRSMANK